MACEKLHRNDSDTKERKYYYPRLPFFEVLICTLLWGGGIVLSISSLYAISRKNEDRYKRYGYLEQGWKHWLGIHQDAYDSEWGLWKKYLWECTVLGFAGHFIISRFAERVWPDRRFEIMLVYTLSFTAHFLGVYGLLFLMGHFTIQYLAVFLTGSTTVCWIAGLSLLYSMQHPTCLKTILTFYSKEDEDKAYVLLVCTGMSNLRYIGYSLEFAWWRNGRRQELLTEPDIVEQSQSSKQSNKKQKRKEEDKKSNEPESISEFSFIDLLIYQMYFPLFYGGPVMNYDEFVRQRRRPPMNWDVEKTKQFITGLLRFAFWNFFTDIGLHFIYTSSLAADVRVVQKMSIFNLCGLSMAQVWLFYMKYLIWYGMPSHFATSDNMIVPGQPQCVYSKHRMTDFWKLIDRGLHKWLVRYVYIPCGGSKAGVLRSIFSLMVTFTFVTYWHGPLIHHLWWGFFCWFGVLVESIALGIYRTKPVQNFENKYLTPAWSRRIRGVFSSFAFVFLIVSNLYFLAGYRVGNIYWKRLYYENIYATLLIHVVLYGASQSSMDRI
uniref:protein-cysteine N-palmitoyltransferase HHAT-like n=1 Tax=Styela clava TaxID=7725 RepID=UPI00193AC74D|nr:protein-cysteine N-palmitoyltransferase HHAT-like [Styela clava]